MYAFIDFICFALGIASIPVFVTQNLTPLVAVSIGWIFLYPVINEVIYNLVASCSQRTVYSGKWGSRFVYHDDYNISLFGIQKCQPLDSQKFRRVYKSLIQKGIVHENEVVVPGKVPRSLLLEKMSKCLLWKVCYTIPICIYVEMPVFLFPAFLLRWRVLNPMLYGTEGTILSALIAVDKGWAVNISGGYHHGSFTKAMGFCVYSDISLCVHYLRTRLNMKRIMIIDLDAHQGNGHGSDALGDENIYIIDAHNPNIFPGDHEAAKAIRKPIYVHPTTLDSEYLEDIKVIEPSIVEFRPQFIIYNAGTDILKGDTLSHLTLSRECIIQRDFYVFSLAVKYKIPINYLLSGGLQLENAVIVSDSIENIYRHFN